MNITRKTFDLSPLLIRQGALLLWGTPGATWTEHGYRHHLYRFNNFYADMCVEAKTGQLAHIVTFSSIPRMAKVGGN
jgi:hypothetical protein